MTEQQDAGLVKAAGDGVHALERDALWALIEQAPVRIALEDAAGRIRWVNRALADALAGRGRAWEGCAAGELESDAGRVLGRVALAAGGDGIAAAVFFAPAAPDDGVRESLRELLDTRFGIDPGTGVLDRHAVQRALDSEVSRSRRYGNPLSVVVLELAGATAAGELPGAVARALKEQLRWADIIGRMGENGFLLVLPETGVEAAERLIGKLREALGPVLAGQGCTARLAAAGWRRGDDAGFLLERALAAL